jgi:uncharacterized membrane protein YhaH (DUF805 family)
LSIWIPFAKYLYTLFGLGVFLPYTAVTVRRLHDIGKSGWNYLYLLIPSMLYVGYLFYFVFKYALSYIQAGNDIDAEFISDLFTTHGSSLVIIGILMLFSLIASVIFIVWMARDSQPGINKWGPNPKEVPSENNSGMNY